VSTPPGQVQRSFDREWLAGAVAPVLAVVLAVIVGAVVVLFSGQNPLTAYQQLVVGAVGTPNDVSETLVASVPLMLTGMAVAFAFRTGLFNIGAEGQLYIGAIASAYVGYKINIPGVFLIPLCLAAAAAGGALWAGIGGFLRATRGAHEVITTMMLNYIAILLSAYLLDPSPLGLPGPMEETTSPGVTQTPPMHAFLPGIVPSSLIPDARLNAGLIVALIAAVVFWFILWRTTLGYRIRAVGLNPKAAAYGGVNVGFTITVAMFIAGAFAGLGGMVQVFGLSPYVLNSTFSSGYGYNAIAVALLGRNRPTGILLGAILFGALEHGGNVMQGNAGISLHLVEIVQGLIILFVAADAVMRYLAGRGVVHLPMWRAGPEEAPV
jgi:general nucleoside transport system permease protein